jgi:predicted ATPase
MPSSNAPTRHVILSGCSGGGKSTLLAELARRGLATVPEPGRRIVAEELAGDDRALPWRDPAAFARRAVAMALQDRAGVAAEEGWVFFDRGLVDAAVALAHTTGADLHATLAGQAPFHRQVFLTPPWRALYRTDAERQHGFDDAVAEYERLRVAYARLGHETVILPQVSVSDRAIFVLDRLS